MTNIQSRAAKVIFAFAATWTIGRIAAGMRTRRRQQKVLLAARALAAAVREMPRTA